MQSEDIYEIIFIYDKKLHKYEIKKRQQGECDAVSEAYNKFKFDKIFANILGAIYISFFMIATTI